MRLIVGVDEDGHQYAVRADTFERLKAYILNSISNSSAGWHYKMYTQLFKRVSVHKTNESLMKDGELIDDLYMRGVLSGRTSRYENILDFVTKAVSGHTDPITELIKQVKACKTEEELLADDLVYGEYENMNIFWGRDMFTDLWDPCRE